ncbi:MAG TPA: hypothetical protein VL362_01910 [Patescibacteria group bacterium]|jgi:hypothetical protein|nr:hypothetical protein [Patescibacteria group bacterium]
MATVFANKYGVHGTHSMYGDLLVASNGNGATYGEMTIKVDNDPVSLQLADIAVMRSEIARCQLPGDEVILEYLAFDEAILQGGLDDDYVSPILETYPDMPDSLRQSIKRNPELIEAFGADNPELALAAFEEAPIGFLTALKADEAHRVLSALTMLEIDEANERAALLRQTALAAEEQLV